MNLLFYDYIYMVTVIEGLTFLLDRREILCEVRRINQLKLKFILNLNIQQRDGAAIEVSRTVSNQKRI